MSKLEEWIAELCPDGVEYKTLGTCVEKIQNIKWADNKESEYRYIDLTSVDREKQQITETQFINSENAPSRAQQIVHTGDVLFGTTRPLLKRYCFIGDEYDGQICSTGLCVLRGKTDIVLQKWIFHQIASSDFFKHVEKYQKGASYPAISDIDVKSFEIPVPPLPVQHEIVRILDNFTELTAELTAELTTELTARKKQYEYYQDLLLTANKRAAVILQIKDITNNRFWIMPSTPKFVAEKCVPYITSKNIKNGNIDFENIKYVTIEDYKQISNNREIIQRDILISMIGTLGEMAIVNSNDLPFYGQNMYLLRLNEGIVIPRYFYHFFDTENMKTHFNKIKNASSQGYLKANHIEDIKIPVPPLAEQERIVAILDRFDALCNDLSRGLPAEIEARRQQYEYYRDKLLTFKEKTA